MLNLVAISRATTEINWGAESAPTQALSVSNHPGQIGLTYTSSAGMTGRKIIKILQSFVFQLDLNHSNLKGTLGATNFQKVGTFF